MTRSRPTAWPHRSYLLRRLPVHVPMAVVLFVVGVGFQRIVTEHWRQGTTLIGGALLMAGIMRVLLPGDRAGYLAVRSQAVDVLCYLILGVLVVVLAATVPGSPYIAR